MTFEIYALWLMCYLCLLSESLILDMISRNRKLIVCYILLVSIICTVNISAFASTHKPPKRQSVTHLMNRQPLDNIMQRIVLIGGGHAHVQVIKALNKHSRPSNIHVTLIDLQSSATYSGIVPGCVAMEILLIRRNFFYHLI